MTALLPTDQVAERLAASLPDAVRAVRTDAISINPTRLTDIARLLHDTPGWELRHLDHVTAIDHEEYFEVIYRFVSFTHNHEVVLRAKLWERIRPEIPSLYTIYRGADFQEREVFDLMGITFTGHPNLQRILTWEDFVGHPLRKDYRLHTIRRSPWGPYKLEP